MTHGFFFAMGGFVDSDDRVVQTQSHLLWYTRRQHLPPAGELQDRSKTDRVAKLLVVLQTLWFVVGCILRHIRGLHIAQLEVLTLAFSSLTAAIYATWWYKPMDVSYPVRLLNVNSESRETTTPDSRAETAGVCSVAPPCYSRAVVGVERCVTFHPRVTLDTTSDEEDIASFPARSYYATSVESLTGEMPIPPSELSYPPLHDAYDTDGYQDGHVLSSSCFSQAPPVLHPKIRSISPEATPIISAINTLGARPGERPPLSIRSVNSIETTTIICSSHGTDVTTLAVEELHPFPDHSCHSTSFAESSAGDMPIHLTELTHPPRPVSRDTMYDSLSSRNSPDAMTWSRASSLSLSSRRYSGHLGHPTLAARLASYSRRISSFILGLSDRSTDDVDHLLWTAELSEIEIESGVSVVYVGCIFGAVFGGLHLLPWRDTFPSHIEGVLWRLAAILVTALPMVYSLLLFTVSHFGGSSSALIRSTVLIIVLPRPFFWIPFFYIIARATLITVAFSSLRNLPDSTFQTVNWTSFIPHL